MKIPLTSCLALLLAPHLLFFSASLHAQHAPGGRELHLEQGWNLESSGKVGESGEVISTTGYQPKGWYTVSVPTTVVAGLVRLKRYPDPNVAMNLRQYPGMSYPIGANFSNFPMEQDSPFAVAWWYRKAFSLPGAFKGKTIWLDFNGINYRANIWVNGKQIANLNEVAGAWRTYEFNITDVARAEGENVVAVEVWAPQQNDLAITFVDWNPQPPDKNMGLWRDVLVRTSGPIALRYPTVVAQVNSPANDDAQLTVTAQLKNATGQAVRGTLKGTIEKVTFEKEVELGPNEVKDVSFTPDQVSQLKFSYPRLWWPLQMGTPNLYPLHMEFEIAGVASDVSDSFFGIREITSQLSDDNKRLFLVNGKRILIRGAGYSSDMLLRYDPKYVEDQLRYVQDMGLNTVRLEGKLEPDDLFDRADRKGILIMAGWCCCDHWEHWSKWSQADYRIAAESLASQIYRLRSHPSLVMWLNGSDNPPPPDVEQSYLGMEKQLLWPNPVISSASAKPAGYSDSSGVKMTGPYEYVAPSYWLMDSSAQAAPVQCQTGGCGGAYGFNTETSPGPAVPPIESLKNFIPKDHLWPIDEYWNYHAGGGAFKDLHVFTEALERRYGKVDNVEDYAFKSQMMTYEAMRAMFEAYSRNKYTSTGVIQWMLNNAWPSLIWHLYDYYLRPAGGYFGSKTALQPLDPMYGYDDHSIWLVSSQYHDAGNLKLSAKVYNLDLTEKFSQEQMVNAPADSTNRIFVLPEIQGLSPTYFLRLTLEDTAGKLVGSNFYWLSTAAETLDWERTTWFTTPTASYADFTALKQLPKVQLNVSSRSERRNDIGITHVTLENPGKDLAFFIRLKVNKGPGGEEILPVVWQDNYVSLLAGEKRELTASYRASDLGTARPTVEIRGWNAEAR
ncbi:MAG: beta galactosidase jelly roll domain-containing protein [Acidobacteria bacterium]|nr:beta galactosidase jelly roll domain-containing protein [Acidobacteriota bacterium]